MPEIIETYNSAAEEPEEIQEFYWVNLKCNNNWHVIFIKLFLLLNQSSCIYTYNFEVYYIHFKTIDVPYLLFYVSIFIFISVLHVLCFSLGIATNNTLIKSIVDVVKSVRPGKQRY